jgi:hypothetical protein
LWHGIFNREEGIKLWQVWNWGSYVPKRLRRNACSPSIFQRKLSEMRHLPSALFFDDFEKSFLIAIFIQEICPFAIPL